MSLFRQVAYLKNRSRLPDRLPPDFGGRFVMVLTLIVLLVVAGTMGYMLIEGWPMLDALFMTIITLSSVGYGEVRPLNQGGVIFSIILIVSGVGVVAYSFSTIADYIVAGELRGILRMQRMMRTIRKLEDHYIICGYGRVGQQVAEGLLADGLEIVVIDNDDERLPVLENRGINHVMGDASEDAILEQAGIQRAKGLCACLPTDAANVFVTLSARTMNPNLVIIARSNIPASAPKMRTAGADQVINPYEIAGRRMASQLLHPNVIEFLEVITRHGKIEWRIEEIFIGPDSEIEGKTLTESHVRGDTGANVLAVRRADGRLMTDMAIEVSLRAGDTLISLGTPSQLTRLAHMAADQRILLSMQRRVVSANSSTG